LDRDFPSGSRNAYASAAVPTIHVFEGSFTLPHESHTNWIMEAPSAFFDERLEGAVVQALLGGFFMSR